MKTEMNLRELSIIALLLVALVDGSKLTTTREISYLRKLAKPKCGDPKCRKVCLGCIDNVDECSDACVLETPSPTTPTPTSPPTPPPPPPIKVAAIIDSLSDTTCCGEVYPLPYLQDYLDSEYPGLFEVAEFAVWGTTICESGNKPYITTIEQSVDGKTPYEQAKEYNSHYIIIMGGANDSKNSNWNESGNGCNTKFQIDAQTLYKSFIDLGSKVFASEPPAVTTNNMGIIDSHIQEQLPMVCCAAEAEGAIAIPTYSFTSLNTGEWLYDGVHFNADGAAALANFFGCYILKQCYNDYPGLCTTVPTCDTPDPPTCECEETTPPSTTPPSCTCSDYDGTGGGTCNNACGGGICIWHGRDKTCWNI